MMFPVYTTAYTAAFVAAAPYYALKGFKSKKYFWSLRQRLGTAGLKMPPPGPPRIWIHALSLGEVVSAAELIKKLDGAGYEVLISTTTRSGFEMAGRLFPRRCLLSLPFDLPPITDRTVARIRPDLFVLVETDIWPNFLASLKRYNVPALLINGRVSPRSLQGYLHIRFFWQRVLGLFSAITCQSRVDRERMILLGADPDRVTVCGNLKCDRPRGESGRQARDRLLAETGLADGVWLAAGSTHEGEEEILLDIFSSLRQERPDLGLILAPRNQERFEPVWRLIKERGLAAARRTGPKPDQNSRVFLLDTLGELDRFYELADIVFVGKSLSQGEGGGHNLLEPAVRAKPVLFGPRMHNFQEIAVQLASSGGGCQVNDPAELATAMKRLLADPAARVAMGQKACQAALRQQGTLDRTMTLIQQHLALRRTP